MSRTLRTKGIRSWPRRGIAAATALLLGTAMAITVSTPATAATAAISATGCDVDYQVYDWGPWGSGFTTLVEVTNLGDAVNGWTLSWDFTGNQQVDQMWNASYTQSGQSVTATNRGSNASIVTDASVTFGFNGSYSGSNADPAEFTLNGVLCEAA